MPAARYVAPHDRYVRSVLLDFDAPADAAFLVGDDVVVRDGAARATDRAAVKLAALIRGRAFPGDWSLVGVRVRGDAPIAVQLIATDAVAEQRVAPGDWRTIWLETAALRARSATQPTSAPHEADDLRLAIVADGGAAFAIDDVVLARGDVTVAESASPRTGQPWRVARVGTAWRATLGDAEIARLPAAPFVEDGYRVVEACAVRVVFRDARGTTVAIDRSGRIVDGRSKTSPPIVEVVDGPARVDRNAAGDRDNDGFDELRGTTPIRATGDRFTLRVADADEWPTLDIAGLRADGEVSVWIEGQLVPWVTRAPDGVTIVELPLRIERPVEVRVRVR